MFVAEILKTKGNAVFSIAPDLTVTQACAELEQKRVGALVVCDGDRVVGVFSDRDVVQALGADGADALDRPVRGDGKDGVSLGLEDFGDEHRGSFSL